MRFLLPSKFRIIGLVMMVAGLAGVWLATSNGLINVYRIIDPAKALANGSYPYPADFWSVNQFVGFASISLTIVGLLAFFFSREQDEFMYRVRLESLQFAAVAQVGVTICLSTYFSFKGDVPLENLMPAIITISIVGFWLLHIIRYSYIVYFKSEANESV